MLFFALTTCRTPMKSFVRKAFALMANRSSRRVASLLPCAIPGITCSFLRSTPSSPGARRMSFLVWRDIADVRTRPVEIPGQDAMRMDSDQFAAKPFHHRLFGYQNLGAAADFQTTSKLTMWPQ